MARRTSSGASPQAAISSSVRRQPSHNPLAGSMRHTEMQGEGTGLCEGCLRTLDEIAAWSSLDDAGKRAVWQRLAQRAGVKPVSEDLPR